MTTRFEEAARGISSTVAEIQEKELKRATPVEKSAFDPSQAKRGVAKPDYTQVPLALLKVTARRLALGEINYGRDNWHKGGEEFIHDSMNHAVEHLFGLISGDQSEDHLGALAWFVAMMAYHEEKGNLTSIGALNGRISLLRKERVLKANQQGAAKNESDQGD